MGRALFKFLSILVVGGSCFAQEISPCTAMLEYIQKNLPGCGTLKEEDGFIYVDLDDRYIHDLIGWVKKEGFEEPPYFGSPTLVGAHITVSTTEEMKKYGVKQIDECGTTVSFTPKSCHAVHPFEWKGVDEVYLIVVEAPELDALRNKYGLPKKQHDFHITIGIKPAAAQSAQPS